MIKRKEFNGKSLKESALLREKLDAPALSAGTVRVYTHTLSAFLNYAVDRGIIEHNPATRLASTKGRSEGQRRPYSSDHLNRIIAGLPDWSNGKHGGRFWIPIIALF